MPEENEELGIFADNATNESNDLDVTQFANPEPVCEPVVELPEDYVLARVEDGAEYKEYAVPKAWVNEEGFIMTCLGCCEVEELIDMHEIAYVEGSWREICSFDDIVWSEACEEYLNRDNAQHVYTRHGEDYVHYEDDYVRCNDTDDCYINQDVANYHDCHYCESCDEWRSAENHDFDECGNESRGGRFNNQKNSQPHYTNAAQKLKYHKDYGTNSPTWSISNGLRYTFGVEIETDSGRLDEWDDLNLNAVYDGSINGNEYVTGVLRGDYGFNHLKKIMNRINTSDVQHHVTRSCGIHVHIGGRFNRRFTIMLLRLCYHLQDDIFRMLPPSRVSNTYCKFIPTWASQVNFTNYKEVLAKYIYGGDGEIVLDKEHNKKRGIDRYRGTRYTWVNINNFSTASGRPTVEFRPHSSTLNYDKIRNWILICMSLVYYAENMQKQIYYNIGDVTLKGVLDAALGSNFGKQLYDYHLERRGKFAAQHKDNAKLPSDIIRLNGSIV